MTNTEIIDVGDDQKELENKALTIPTQAQCIVVASSADMEAAERFHKDVKAMIKQIDDVFKPMADKAFQSHRAITGKWAEIKKPLTNAMDIVTGKVRAYIQEEKRKAEAVEARLREESRRLEEERMLAEAAELEKEGRHEEAEEVIAAPIQVITPTVRPDVPKYDARTFRPPTPKARVINKAKFIAWVAASPDRLDMVDANERALNAKAKSMGKSLNIPGVEYYEI